MTPATSKQHVFTLNAYILCNSHTNFHVTVNAFIINHDYKKNLYGHIELQSSSQSLDFARNMKSVKICSVFLLIVCTSPVYATPVSSENDVLKEDTADSEAKGILDGVTGNAPTTTAAPGLGNLPGFGQNVANAGPMLIIGGFQAVVTKFDPSLIQGLPGLSGMPQIPTGK